MNDIAIIISILLAPLNLTEPWLLANYPSVVEVLAKLMYTNIDRILRKHWFCAILVLVCPEANAFEVFNNMLYLLLTRVAYDLVWILMLIVVRNLYDILML